MWSSNYVMLHGKMKIYLYIHKIYKHQILHSGNLRLEAPTHKVTWS